MTVIENLEQVAAFAGGKHGQSPVVQNQELGAAKRLEHSAVATVAASDAQGFEQTRDAMVENRAVIAAGFVSESTSNPTFAQAAGPGDQQVLVAIDPVAADELGEDGPVDATWGAQIDVFYACILAQRRKLEAHGEPACITFGGFAIDKKADAIFERQGIEIG